MAKKDSEIAYLKIRKMIVTTELEPGQEIDMAKLMAKLELGRTPIREALNRLSYESFVKIMARKGMIVADLNIHDMEKLRELRLYFVNYLSDKIISNIEPEDIDMIRQKRDSLMDMENTFMSCLLSDIEFHEVTHKLCKNKFAEEEQNKILYLGVRAMVKEKSLGVDIESLIDDYNHLINFIETKDKFGLESMLLSHILNN